MNISLQVGYGLKPNENALTLTSALTQLNSSARQIGVRSRSGSPTEKWPKELTYSLEDRVKEARLFVALESRSGEIKISIVNKRRPY